MEPQKRELLVSPGSNLLLFNQPLLEKISSQLKEDALVSSSLSLSKLSRSSGRAKSSQPASQRYSSHLKFSRPGSSGIGNDLLLPLGVPFPSGVVVVGACLLRTPIRVFGSRRHVPVQ